MVVAVFFSPSGELSEYMNANDKGRTRDCGSAEDNRASYPVGSRNNARTHTTESRKVNIYNKKYFRIVRNPSVFRGLHICKLPPKVFSSW